MGIYAEKTKEALIHQEGGLAFVEVSGEEELKNAVYRGEYDCGFVLPQDFESGNGGSGSYRQRDLYLQYCHDQRDGRKRERICGVVPVFKQ